MDKNVGRVKANKIGQAEDKKSLPIFVKYGLIALAILVVIAIGLVVYFRIAGSYVATVGSEKIGTGEFRYYLEVEKQNMYNSALRADPNLSEETFWNTKISGENAIDVAKKSAMDNLKTVKIQLIKAKESKISLTSDELKSIDDSIKTNIIDKMGSGNKIKASQALQKEYNFTIDDLRNAQIENYTVQKYQSGEMDKIAVTDADIKSYYDKNPDWYKSSLMRNDSEEAVWARHILIKVATDATQADKDAAKKKAEDILAKAKAGEDFATLAKDNSEDSNAKYGGSYVFGKGKMVAEFENAAFSLSPGQIYDTLVQTTYGYHIIKLEEKYAKDQPVSLKCATEYYEYGTGFIKSQLYTEKLDGWKKDTQYNVKLNPPAYNSIT